MAHHDFPGEDLARFDLGGRCGGAEELEAPLFEFIGDAQSERQLGTHHGQVHAELLGEVGELHGAGSVDGDAVGHGSDASIAGRNVKLGDVGTLTELPGQGVLATSAAHHQDLHGDD